MADVVASAHAPLAGSKRSAESAYDTIRDAIMRGELVPGAVLVEATLATWCKVSRTPIREALTRLGHDGLVIRADRGLVVRDRSPEEILDIYSIRVVLESAAAATAAERASSLDKKRLEKIHGDLVRGDIVDPGERAAANRRFHHAIWAACRNDSLIDLLDRLDLHLGRYPETTLSHKNRWETSLLEHAALVDAIVASDAERAGQIAREHFDAARDIRMELSVE